MKTTVQQFDGTFDGAFGGANLAAGEVSWIAICGWSRFLWLPSRNCITSVMLTPPVNSVSRIAFHGVGLKITMISGTENYRTSTGTSI